MSPDPNFIMHIAEETFSLRFAIIDGDLKYRRHRPGVIDDQVRGFVHHFRDLIFDEIAERDRLAQTVANVLDLNDAEQDQWVSEVRESHPFDQHYQHDRAALGRVLAIRRQRKEQEKERVA